MRAQWILLLCLECAALASASISRRGLRHGRGTVAERRQVPYRSAPVEEEQEPLPAFNMYNSENTPSPLDQQPRPESLANMAKFKLAMPTPEPAALNGAFCRGGACQYRVNVQPTLPPQVTMPPIPLGGAELASREFCRGLACIKGMGMPLDHGLAPFTLNCVHLFNDIGGGMVGDDLSRNVAQVHDSFERACRKRVDILEAGRCADYANTFVGALAVKVNSPTVGGTVEVCQDAFFWTKAFKEAEIDLGLAAVTLPKRKSLLAANLNRFGTGGVGPSSPRGLKWRQYAWTHGELPQPPAVAQQLSADGSIEGALLQKSKSAEPPAKPPLTVAGKDRDRGLPRYQPNTLNEAEHPVPISKTKYQIAPASPDGAVPPVEVAGDLFDHCSQQFSEIMAGFTQTAVATVHMTKAWCGWQSGVASWVGQKEEFGHPDWSPRTCSGMQNLVAFAMRDDLANTTGGFSAQQVCKKIFLTIGSVHRAEGLVKAAWESPGLRGPPESGLPPADDADMQAMLLEAQEYANAVYSKLRHQKVKYEKLNNLRADMAAAPDPFPKVDPPLATPPDLPRVNDFDPTALLALSVERVRQSRRVGISVVQQLTPWGFGA